MSKLSEMDAAIKELRDIAASINDIANWLTGTFSADTEPEADTAPAPAAKEPEPVLAFEDVRAILADKSREGFTAQIRDLLQKFGAKKLSEVDPAHYKTLIADRCRLLSLMGLLYLTKEQSSCHFLFRSVQINIVHSMTPPFLNFASISSMWMPIFSGSLSRPAQMTRRPSGVSIRPCSLSVWYCWYFSYSLFDICFMATSDPAMPLP